MSYGGFSYTASNFVQMSAEPSHWLELCRVQPKFFKFFCIIPIVLQKFSLSMKNSENFDAKELLEIPLNDVNKTPSCKNLLIWHSPRSNARNSAGPARSKGIVFWVCVLQ